jgi:hypothetical protein
VTETQEDHGWRAQVCDADGRPRGAGVLVDSDLVLTSARVLAGMGGSSPRGGPSAAALSVNFPAARAARVQQVSIRGADGAPASTTGAGQLALLRLAGRSGVEPARLAPCGDPGDRLVWVYGHPPQLAGGIWARARIKRNSGQARAEFEFAADSAPGPLIGRGFGGAGVLVVQTGAVIGVVVGGELKTEAQRALMIPIEVGAEAFPALGRLLRRQSPLWAWLSQLLDAVLAVPAMADDRSRDMVVQLLRPDIATTVQRHPVARFDVWAILRSCLNYSRGLAELAEVIRVFEGNSTPMQQLDYHVVEHQVGARPATSRDLGDVVTDTSPPAKASQEPGLPTGQPAVWGNVPARNPNFTGRVAMLETLREQLTDKLTALLPHALHGLGGVGKTQLAVEYVWRFASSYDLVWWISAEQPALIRSSLASLAARLELPAGEDLDKMLIAVHDALRTHNPHQRWLLVFDNADRPEDLDRFLSTPGGHILITSRNRAWSGVAETVEVDVFSREESVELVKRRLPAAPTEEADRLADSLGDLPLALEQAAAWMLATGTPVPEYLRLLEEQVGQLLLESPPTNYPLPVVATWGLAFDQLSRQAPAAVQLLELCSFLGAEPVSIRLLPMGRYASLPSPLDATVRDEIPLRRAVRDISRYGLAKVDPARNSIEIHRLVQAVLRDRLTEEQRAAYQRSVHELLAAANPGDPTGDPQSWPRHAELAPHVLPAKLIEGDTLESHKVVLDQVRYLWVTGDYQSSWQLAENAYRDWHERLGPDYEQALMAGRYLANALRSVGRTDEARALNEEIWARTRRTFGENHEHTLAVANSVGADLRWQGRWREARELDEDILERHKGVFGEDDPSTLNSANNLAVDLRLLCDYDRARQLDEETIERRRRVIGDDHPLTLFGISSLSRDYYGLGDFQTARTLQRQSLPVHRAKLGPDHSDVMRATRVHTLTLRSLGEYPEACEIGEELVTRSRRVLGDDHPDTLGALTALANSLALVDRSTEARMAGEDALARYRNVLGNDNPFTLAAATNLAIALRAAKEHVAARRLNEAALACFTAALGEDHPFTLACAINMAVDFAVADEYTAARELGERTLAALRRVSGPGHPDTLVCASNLAIDLRSTGDTEAALALAEKTVMDLRKALGHSHPETLLAETGRHNSLYIEPATP